MYDEDRVSFQINPFYVNKKPFLKLNTMKYLTFIQQHIQHAPNSQNCNPFKKPNHAPRPQRHDTNFIGLRIRQKEIGALFVSARVSRYHNLLEQCPAGGLSILLTYLWMVRNGFVD